MGPAVSEPKSSGGATTDVPGRKDAREFLRVRQNSLTLGHFTGDSLLHFSYNPVPGGSASMGLPDSHLAGSFVTAFSQGLNSSLNVPFMTQALSPSPMGESSFIFPSVARNPNKAIVTIDSRTSRILVANEMTCELFAYQRDELVGMKVQQLFTEPYRARHRVLVEQNIDRSGETVLTSPSLPPSLCASPLLVTENGLVRSSYFVAGWLVRDILCMLSVLSGGHESF